MKSSPKAHCHLPRSLGYLHGGPFTPLVGPDLKSPTTNTKTDHVKTPSKWLDVPLVATGTARTRYDIFFLTGDLFTARMCGVGNVFSSHPMAFSPKRRDAISRRECSVFRVANRHRVFSRTPSRGSTVVFPTRRSGFTISAASARPSTISLSASTSSPTSMSSWAPRPSRPLVFAPTSESPSARRRHHRNPARIRF